MTDQEINIAIAGACGWKWDDTSIHNPNGGRFARYARLSRTDQLHFILPDYCHDLNAMHEASLKAGPNIIKGMRFWLYEFCDQMTAHESTARQRAEAFLRTIGKWKE